ncbi:hypothetical protein EBT23_01360 [bacterium]|nr:hypothetical protein [Verrucomicrobiota bacterium]NBS54214.1 hypothetical protein [bacterium]
MKKSDSPFFTAACLTILLFLGFGSHGSAQESSPYILQTGCRLELAGFPVMAPALDAGTVVSVKGSVISWNPTFQDKPFGSALPPGEEFYAEVVAPPSHAWLGHRLEIDEAATRTRSDHSLVVMASPLNTRGLPDGSMIGARLEVRRHLTVEALWGETVKNRLIFAGEKGDSFFFSVAGPGSPAGTRSATPRLDSQNLLAWLDPYSASLAKINQPMVIPPGTAVATTFGERRGSALGFSGVTKTWPTALPLQAGINLLAYPYPRDLRLGVDWGTTREGFQGAAKPSPTQDLIEIWAGKDRFVYAPELQADGGIRWRRLHPVFPNRDWASPASYLDQIPVGQGFVLRKAKADPRHFFYTPNP